jgi:hypothetical protein
MIQISYRPTNEADLTETVRGKGTPINNVLTISIPLCLVVSAVFVRRVQVDSGSGLSRWSPPGRLDRFESSLFPTRSGT